MKNETKFLTYWFSELNKQNIQYAVLRNYESLPQNCGGSDIDIWVKKEDYNQFIYITNNLIKENYAILSSYTPDNYCPRIIYLAIDWGIQLDVHIGIANHKGIPYIDSSIIEKNIEKYNDINVLSPKVDILICFLKEILNNKKCKTIYCEQASDLIDTLSEEEIESYLKAFSKDVRNKIIDILKRRDFSKESISQLGIICSNDLQSIKSKVQYYSKQILKFKRLFKQPGYTIAFLGTDGSGKSTIINAIIPTLNEAFHNGIRYEHMRPNYIQSLAVFMGKKKREESMTVCSNPHGSKPSGFIGSLIRLNYYMIDYTWGFLRKIYFDKSLRTHVWIFDRYYYDYLIDPQRGRISLPQWILKLYSWFVPTPDLILCLGGEPQKIYERKPETSLKEVERQTTALMNFCKKTYNAVWIDTTTNPQVSIDKTMKAIQTMMEKRFKDAKLYL